MLIGEKWSFQVNWWWWRILFHWREEINPTTPNFLTMDGQFLPIEVWLAVKGKEKNLCWMNLMPQNTTQKGDFSSFSPWKDCQGNWTGSSGRLHCLRCAGQIATCLEKNDCSIRADGKQTNKKLHEEQFGHVFKFNFHGFKFWDGWGYRFYHDA